MEFIPADNGYEKINMKKMTEMMNDIYLKGRQLGFDLLSREVAQTGLDHAALDLVPVFVIDDMLLQPGGVTGEGVAADDLSGARKRVSDAFIGDDNGEKRESGEGEDEEEKRDEVDPHEE